MATEIPDGFAQLAVRSSPERTGGDHGLYLWLTAGERLAPARRIARAHPAENGRVMPAGKSGGAVNPTTETRFGTPEKRLPGREHLKSIPRWRRSAPKARRSGRHLSLYRHGHGEASQCGGRQPGSHADGGASQPSRRGAGHHLDAIHGRTSATAARARMPGTCTSSRSGTLHPPVNCHGACAPSGARVRDRRATRRPMLTRAPVLSADVSAGLPTDMAHCRDHSPQPRGICKIAPPGAEVWGTMPLRTSRRSAGSLAPIGRCVARREDAGSAGGHCGATGLIPHRVLLQTAQAASQPNRSPSEFRAIPPDQWATPARSGTL